MAKDKPTPAGACAQCGKAKLVMVPMAPGPDKKPWELCSACWLEGARPEQLGTIPKRYIEESDPPPPRRIVGTRDPSFGGGIQYVPDGDGYW